ncbi:hypothetical protein [Dyadobacter frigoris]|uniref:DUF4237 domain-containing protein n=1 Tax=Dyadobacter frigoris TaxID=2576211 RepID=A0A4U6DH21_9BACT|nr:hypothetical protein [Dyadobacter frigoris]TKT93974.1 hypothetical protein FDK13_01820 [Dyadobacter frigoris]GLU50807.1 hypothetical protein Dfri01_02680 [Dyadobacter frigoris]
MKKKSVSLLLLWLLLSVSFISCTDHDVEPQAWLNNLETLLGQGTKSTVEGWIDAGLDDEKTKEAFDKSGDKAALFNSLKTAISIYDQRVYIEDWDHIPGIEKGNYVANGLKSGVSNASWANPDLDLSASDAANFADAKADELSAGTKIYRVTGGNPAGGYWTAQIPASVGDVIGGTAVRPAWNNFSKFYVYEVPAGQTLKVWRGTTAAQQIADGVINPFLPGKAEQIFIPFVVRDATFKTLVKEIPLPW